MATKVMSRTFQKAAELAGGQKPLARKLRVPLGELQRWIAGTGEPPLAIFLKAVDLVLEETPSPAAASDLDDPPSPRDCAAAGDSSFP
jgi:hypothetical protein